MKAAEKLPLGSIFLCWKISFVVLVFKNAGEWSVAKNYHPANLLLAVSKIFEIFLHYRLVNHIAKCCLFSDFYSGFESSPSTTDISNACECSVRLFSTLTHVLWNLRSGIWPYFMIFSVIDGFKWFLMGSLSKNI